MCQKTRFSCGHVTERPCNKPIVPSGKVDTGPLAMFCAGMPANATDDPNPCFKCILKGTPSRDEPESTKSEKKPAEQTRGGEGNNSRDYKYRFAGWISVSDLGAWPWNEVWMAPMIGMVFDEEGYAVNDPESKIPYFTMILYPETYPKEFGASYENWNDKLEAVSSNPAYANIEYEKEFRMPADPILVEYVKRIGYPDTEILAVIDAVNGATSASHSVTSSPTASLFTDSDGLPDTPTTPAFSNDLVAMYPKVPNQDSDAFKARSDLADATEDIADRACCGSPVS